MRNIVASLLVLLVSSSSLVAQQKNDTAPLIAIESVALGDTPEGVVTKLTFRYDAAKAMSRGGEVILSGSISSGSTVFSTFRKLLRPDESRSTETIVTLPAGAAQVETRLMAESEHAAPTIIAKVTTSIEVKPTGTAYVAAVEHGAEGILAEGVVETGGALKIRPPRRDLAPNLFIVEVEAQPSVKRVEFFVGEKKIFTRNAPPFRAELDLGNVPRRVEIRVVGYDASGRYLDADAWIVNERETPLEAKITRTVTKDGVSHFKVSVQSSRDLPLKTVELYAGDRKLVSWSQPPYSFSIPTSSLQGVDFVRATAIDSEGLEATDLLFLDGRRFAESIEVNLVELPVTVVDPKGAAITDLKADDFTVFEDGKQQKVSDFGFSANLPLSIGVLVDHSGSMKPRITDARKAAIDFFEQILRQNDRAFFGGFSWEATKISPLTSELGSLKAQVESMPDADGGTALYDAIVSGLYQFRGVEGRKALLIVSDGDDTASRVDYEQMLTYVRAARVPLYFIGIGVSPLLGGGKLKGLAAETGGVAYFIRKVDELKETYAQLEKELRSQYLISYYTQGGSGADQQKYRTVEVKVARPDAKVRTIRGFLP
jgi:Ca-activated chloride channel family protein